MIEEDGVVVGASDNELAIRIDPEGSCDGCPVRENCYANGRIVRVPLQPGVAVDDRVRLSIRNASVLQISALVYGAPLVALVVGIAAGYLLLFPSFPEDARILLSVAIGGALFALSALFVGRTGRRINAKLEHRIKIRRSDV